MKSLKRARSKGRTRSTKSSSASYFATLVNQHQPAGGRLFPLTNFTFFLGAGFSKAWSPSYPTGPELFQVSSRERDLLTYVERAANFTGVSPIAGLNMDDIKQLIYSLDMSQRYPSIRPRYVDNQNIAAVKSELSAFFCKRFQAFVGPDWYWFDPKTQKFKIPRALTTHQQGIQAFFDKMFNLIDGSTGFMEGARFNFLTTNYDWLVEAIVDSVLPGDSSLGYLYRGVTADEITGCRSRVIAYEHNLVFNLFKINGGFEIFKDNEGYRFDYRAKKADDCLPQAPVLMLPSREQDYVSDYFTAVFPKAVRLLNETKVLVIVGYSLPDEDALVRFIIRQFCEDEADAAGKWLFYVDSADRATLHRRVKSVFPFAGSTLRVSVHSGNFSDWASEVAAAIR